LAPLRLATRQSPLARWQAEHVARLLRAAHPGLEVELVPVATTGDRLAHVPVGEMGGQGVFVREVQALVLAGQADAAVHSAKDLPSLPARGLRLVAVPPRGDPRDALVGRPLSGLGPGSRVATGSPRRQAQLAWLRPDLSFCTLRGNIATRLAKVPEGGAIVVARAALDRLGLAHEQAETLGTDLMLPQVAQGALAVECREGDEASMRALSAIEDPVARREVDAERSFLRWVSQAGAGAPGSEPGGCNLPVAAHATSAGGQLFLEGLLASPDGRTLVRQGAKGPASDPDALGRQVAEGVLALGGQELLVGGRPA